MRRHYLFILVFVGVGWTAFLLGGTLRHGFDSGQAGHNGAAASSEAETGVRTEVVASGLEHPWGLAFLPDGRMLVTERPGRLRIVSKEGVVSGPLAGVPEVFAQGQGGLLDVALDPDFTNNQRIYFSYAEAEGGLAGTAVARAVLGAQSISGVEVIFRQQPKVEGGKHFGSRLVFGPEGNLFVMLGERFDYREKAQLLDNHLGKVVRIRGDGAVPEDNPFVGKEGVLPEIWSYGHRNGQGAAVHPQTGVVWMHEHGPRGGDEINLPAAGKNYGWPEASYGSHYSMVPIPDEHAERGFVEPAHYWTPSIAPSGMAFYTGERYPGWKGSLFVGALVGKHLARLELDGEKVVREEQLLVELEARIRDVRQGPDGFLYLLTDAEEGQILRVLGE